MIHLDDIRGKIVDDCVNTVNKGNEGFVETEYDMCKTAVMLMFTHIKDVSDKIENNSLEKVLYLNELFKQDVL